MNVNSTSPSARELDGLLAPLLAVESELGDPGLLAGPTPRIRTLIATGSSWVAIPSAGSASTTAASRTSLGASLSK